MMGTSAGEAQLILSCVSSYARGEAWQPVKGRKDELDWPLVLRMAERHSVTPLVYRALSSAPNELPSNTLTELHQRYRLNAIRNAYLAHELGRLIVLLKENRVTAASFKGPLLAHVMYGDLSLREFVDLDLLVRAEDLPATREVLTSQGYASDLSGVPQSERQFFQIWEEDFEKKNSPICLDVHWRMNPQYFAYAPEGSELWRRLVEVELQGVAVKTLSTVDLLLHLCVHGARHRWTSLAWICDVAVVVNRSRDIDWPQLVAEAASLGGQRLLLLGLYLAYDILGARVPDELIAPARRDAVCVKLANEVKGQLFPTAAMRASVSPKWMVQYSHWMFSARAIASAGGRVRYLVGRVFSPTLADWDLVRLPRPLFFLYYALRPIRLTFEYGPRLLRNLFRLASSRADTLKKAPQL